MDPQTLLMAFVAFIVIIISLYIMSVFGMQEKTYEEVIAEQRRLNAQAEQRAKENKKDKKKDKKWKKGKDKDKLDTKSGSDSDTGIHKMVELELEPEIIEPIEVGKVSPRSDKPSKKTKSILHNKEERPVVSKAAVVEEAFHPEHMPKDEVEMKYERQQSVDKDQLKPKKKPKEVRKEVVEEAVVIETITAVSAAPPVEKKPEKKSKSKASDRGNVGQVLTVINEVTLTEVDLQILIDFLLEKQGSSIQWTKSGAKGDPLTVLKKQLEDKERQLTEEQQLSLSGGKKKKVPTATLR